MVVTNSEKIAKRISIMCLHGIDREVWNKYRIRAWKSAVKKRVDIANNYLKVFKSNDFLILPEKLKITRNEFVQKLMHSGIGTSVHFKPLHLMPYYKRLYNFKPEDFPNALKKSNRILYS